MKRHIFVIGDLYVDHDIFVTELESRSDSGAVEPRFNVVRRQDTAGGAANSARILSVLSDGETYLWGIVGHTHWGTFRDVLEKSQAIDAVGRAIELRGVTDETDPKMNTVTRLLVVSEHDTQTVRRRFCRYYDINRVHVPESKRETLLYYLERAHKKSALHAIVINDFGRGSLTKPLIDAVAKAAALAGIPLFIDPHFARTNDDRRRYAGIAGTAIVPNLPEWCELVSDNHGANYWRLNLNEPEALREMAILSFQHLGNFDYHIVKCDRQGAVLFFPHPDPTKTHQYGLYHLEPATSSGADERVQMGSGDLMTAVFALEFPRKDPTTPAVLTAIQKANAAVASYRDMPWHQMPSRKDVMRMQAACPWNNRPPDAEITKGILFLPAVPVIRLSDFETSIEGLFSQDATFKQIVNDLVTDVTHGGNRDPLRSMVLGAPPGTGKTTIMRALKARALASNIAHVDMTSTEGSGGLQVFSPERFREAFRQLRSEHSEPRTLICVDEALREPAYTFLLNNAPTLMDSAHAESIRFLFLSAAFTPELEKEAKWRELFRRTRTYYLSNLAARPFDIPYIIPARCFEKLPSVTSVRIAGAVLLAVTDLALAKPEPSFLCAVADELLEQHVVGATQLTITLENLPDKYRKGANPRGNFQDYEFQR